MEFGPDGTESLEAGRGDFLYVAPYAIHREGDPSEETTAIGPFLQASSCGGLSTEPFRLGLGRSRCPLL